MFPSFLMDEHMQRRMEEARQQTVQRRTGAAVDWTPDTPWRRELNITAKSWQRWSLFDVLPMPGLAQDVAPEHHVDSPLASFRYVERVLPRGEALSTVSGSTRGTVMFDGDVAIPCLYELRRLTDRANPWMSITPMEVMTLRVGTRAAVGDVVVAGLGLGWQLTQVLLKRSVTRVTLVERSLDLVEWILPRVLEKMTSHCIRHSDAQYVVSMDGVTEKRLDVIVDNAHNIVPKLHADVALIDIFPNYGGNTFAACPHIKKVWCWGAAPAPSR